MTLPEKRCTRINLLDRLVPVNLLGQGGGRVGVDSPGPGRGRRRTPGTVLLHLVDGRHADAVLAEGSDHQGQHVECDRHPPGRWFLDRELITEWARLTPAAG